jgi:hypothetical protein
MMEIIVPVPETDKIFDAFLFVLVTLEEKEKITYI